MGSRSHKFTIHTTTATALYKLASVDSRAYSSPWSDQHLIFDRIEPVGVATRTVGGDAFAADAAKVFPTEGELYEILAGWQTKVVCIATQVATNVLSV